MGEPAAMCLLFWAEGSPNTSFEVLFVKFNDKEHRRKCTTSLNKVQLFRLYTPFTIRLRHSSEMPQTAGTPFQLTQRSRSACCFNLTGTCSWKHPCQAANNCSYYQHHLSNMKTAIVASLVAGAAAFAPAANKVCCREIISKT